MKISCKQNQCHENYANIRKYKSNRICMDDSARKSTSKVSCCKISKRPTWNRNHFKFGTEKYSNIDNRYKHIFQVFDRKLKSCHSSCPDPGGVLGYVISGRVDFRLSTFVLSLLLWLWVGYLLSARHQREVSITGIQASVVTVLECARSPCSLLSGRWTRRQHKRGLAMRDYIGKGELRFILREGGLITVDPCPGL